MEGNTNPQKMIMYGVHCTYNGIPPMEIKEFYVRVNADILDDFINDIRKKNYSINVCFRSED
jgi:hypothetical protein